MSSLRPEVEDVVPKGKSIEDSLITIKKVEFYRQTGIKMVEKEKEEGKCLLRLNK